MVKVEACSYQQRWSGHFQQPSWVGSSLRHQHCWPERCGSAAAGDTLHGQWRLLHVVGSCKNNTRTMLIFDQIVHLSIMWTFNSLYKLPSIRWVTKVLRLQLLLHVSSWVCIPVFTVFGIDNGRAQSVYQHLSSTFVVVDPKEEKKSTIISSVRGSVLICIDWN